MNRTTLAALGFIFLLSITLAVWCGTRSADSNTGPCAQRAEVSERLTCYANDYKSAQWRFSWAYHLCVYGAAILSALAAWLAKIETRLFGLDNSTRRNNAVASFAAIASLLIAISTAGKLEDSWHNNMTKRYAVESLLNQFLAESDPTPEELEAYGKRLARTIDSNAAPVEPPSVCPPK